MLPPAIVLFFSIGLAKMELIPRSATIAISHLFTAYLIQCLWKRISSQYSHDMVREELSVAQSAKMLTTAEEFRNRLPEECQRRESRKYSLEQYHELIDPTAHHIPYHHEVADISTFRRWAEMTLLEVNERVANLC